MARIDLQFASHLKPKILNGEKPLTIRGSPKGMPGDTFEVDGHVFELVMVHPLQFSDAYSKLYRPDGYSSPAEMKSDWYTLHPGEKWHDSSIVYAHWFRPVVVS